MGIKYFQLTVSWATETYAAPLYASGSIADATDVGMKGKKDQ